VTTPCDLLTHAQCRHRDASPSPPPRYRRRFSYTRILGDLIVLVSTVHTTMYRMEDRLDQHIPLGISPENTACWILALDLR